MPKVNRIVKSLIMSSDILSIFSICKAKSEIMHSVCAVIYLVK